MEIAQVIKKIEATHFQGRRRLVALAGPPASGKSTLAEALARHSMRFQCVPMDGFHFENDHLRTMDRLHRKGAPDTFDVAGLLDLVKRLQRDPYVHFPTFDRANDSTVRDGGSVDETIQTIIFEGNYLLLDQPGWRDLKHHWDMTILLDVPKGVLQARLMQRWLDLGMSRDVAQEKTHQNDLKNAMTVLEQTITPDLTLPQT